VEKSIKQVKKDTCAVLVNYIYKMSILVTGINSSDNEKPGKHSKR
jgi:hypothetical protein